MRQGPRLAALPKWISGNPHFLFALLGNQTTSMEYSDAMRNLIKITPPGTLTSGERSRPEFFTDGAEKQGLVNLRHPLPGDIPMSVEIGKAGWKIAKTVGSKENNLLENYF
jgi:hypothetical protein